MSIGIEYLSVGYHLDYSWAWRRLHKLHIVFTERGQWKQTGCVESVFNLEYQGNCHLLARNLNYY